MSTWLESHTTLREHPKRKRLSRLLGQNLYETIGLLHVMWWWVLDFAPEGDLSDFSDDDIADAVDWPDDAGALMGALVRAGFVDADRHVHDWDEYAEKWIARRVANRERMRVARARRNGPAESGFAHVSRTSGARAPQKPKCVGLPDLPTYLPDRTNQPDPPPLPPSPQAGKGEKSKRNGDPPVAGGPEAAPATAADRALWQRAMAEIATLGLTPGNVELIGRLHPVGRGTDGGLTLQAPLGSQDVQRFQHIIARALLDAGDHAGPNVRVAVEGSIPAPSPPPGGGIPSP